MKRCVLGLCVAMVFSSLAMADWNPQDGSKMHYPQMPNPNGWDICLNHAVVADDFQCAETGPITDVHFWVSWQNDYVRWDLIQSIGLNLYGDGGNQPGPVLKAYTILPGSPNFSYRLAGSGAQGWFCPASQFTNLIDHQNYYQINLKPLEDPLIQTIGTRYWLGINIVMLPDGDLDPANDPQIGWKTSLDHWGSNSKYKNGALPWQFVMPNGQYVDQAFVITPEPATMALVMMGMGISLLRRKR